METETQNEPDEQYVVPGFTCECPSVHTLREENMDRFLRDVRTITVHDPYDYKAKLVGECVVRGNYSYVPFLT